MKYSISKAAVNDHISFSRGKREVFGIVTSVKENSVIVELSSEDAKYFQYESNLTVVNHKNYLIIINS
ncbi:hypothetical protein BACSP_04144 [Bacillus sp. T2.9-1]|uniref:DUF2187 family protein n=1 Tax=Bacillus sp. T2.9-1 TaxID=3041163 RepID=UPI002477B222|nr:DUF2187 family protein [Bacillus sp. T2.9-1]CAI9395549.1 hypothetical protein BACSP_04144 [Bacillus sp. T2.9-1]